MNRDLGVLKCIVNRAVFNGLLEKNPIQKVRAFREESRDRTLTHEEYRSLLGYCSPRLSAIVQLAYWTGMRKGEILGLRWEQVDFQNKVVNLEAADTKTQEKREVPLTEALIEPPETDTQDPWDAPMFSPKGTSASSTSRPLF